MKESLLFFFFLNVFPVHISHCFRSTTNIAYIFLVIEMCGLQIFKFPKLFKYAALTPLVLVLFYEKKTIKIHHKHD